MSTKKEKCCECTSKERPSHVFRSSGTPGMKDGGYFTCNCPCHQSEIIEWEKELKDMEVVMTVPDLEELLEKEQDSEPYLQYDQVVPFIRHQIASAVAKREFEIADEVKKLYSPDYMKGSPSSYINRVLDQVISIIKH